MDVAELWLPILVSAVFVFVVSSIVHMAMPYHKSDHGALPQEGEVMAFLRKVGVQPGSSYVFPFAKTMNEMSSPEMVEKMNQGPVGFMTLMPNGPWAMGKQLTLWFVYSVVIGVFMAYIGGFSLTPASTSAEIFRVTGSIGFLGFAMASVPESIWKGVRWSVTFKFIFDGTLYGLAGAAAFVWLWPGA